MTTFRAAAVLAVIASTGVMAAPAAAQEGAGVHQHDGFFLRFQTGLGYTRIKGDVGPADVTFSGASSNLNFALGGRVASNLLLFGELGFAGIRDPQVKVEPGGTTTLDEIQAGMGGLGIGLAYYLPSNVYLSGTLSFPQMVLRDTTGDRDDSYNSKTGIGLALSVGKEWWVSANWALGVAAGAVVGQAKGKDRFLAVFDPGTWRGTGLHVMFSATFN